MGDEEKWRAREGRNAVEKARRELAGLADGILADSAIRVDELVHLATWLRERRRNLGPEYAPLAEEVDDVLADGRIDADAEIRLRDALVDATERCDPSAAMTPQDAAVLRLIGFLKGITSDREVNEAELGELEYRLDEPELSQSSIAGVIRRTVDAYAMDPGRLQRSLAAIAGHDPESGVVSGLAISSSFDDPDDPAEIMFAGSSFCLTGSFQYGPRSRCTARIHSLGGEFHKTATRQTDYLVIGTMETKAWAGPSYGRKIEAALAAREKGRGAQIISEATWHEAAKRAESRRAWTEEVDPEQYFAGWVYRPNRAQRPALGIELRERIEPEKTRAARDRAIAKGLERKNAAKIRITVNRWTATRPLAYSLQRGDLFHSDGEKRSIQIAHDGEPLEVHSDQSGIWRAYQISAADLAQWLRTGIEPMQCRIDPNLCRSEIHRFLLTAELKKAAK